MRVNIHIAVNRALDAFAAKQVWVFNIRSMARITGFNERNTAAFLQRNGELLGIKRAGRMFYLNPKVKPPFHALYHLAALMRPDSPFYLSLESVLHEHDWVSQIPNRYTFVTTGRAAVIETVLGTIEFNRVFNSNSFLERLKGTHFDQERGVRVASPQLALADLKALNRNLDLVRPEHERTEDYSVVRSSGFDD
nr:hypothetical protein [Pseudomonas luteola]